MRQKTLAVMIPLLAAGACLHHRPPAAPPAALPDYVADTTGQFWIRIDRRVPPERAFALLAGERFAPDADSVRRATARVARAGPYQRGQWWFDEFDGVRLPYALTEKAVRYYIELADTFRRNGGRGIPNSPPMISVSLSYVVTVTRADSLPAVANHPRDGYLVEMTLGWSDTCGNVCGLSFQKTRRVWVSAAGQVIAVEGDGMAQSVVS